MNHPRNAVLAALLTTALAIALHPQSASSAGRADRWTADLSVVDADDVNVRHTRTGLRLADARPPGGSARRSAVAEGMLVSVPRALSRPATRIRAQATIAARSAGCRPGWC
ncbi:hypothetical protein [Verrucosispora sioxanthis]|uniref:hypothetical protein n=1 Tax=Verrucosispora sioxanthis TaxID=2499994 RepID=UPI0020A0C660|nr:hypothetical protein [Verrucosispora sioxanthis]